MTRLRLWAPRTNEIGSTRAAWTTARWAGAWAWGSFVDNPLLVLVLIFGVGGWLVYRFAGGPKS